MISMDSVAKVLAGRCVLAGVTLRVQPGEVLALVGPSGTGKSVLLRLLVGLLEPDHGEIDIAGQSLVRAGYRQLAAIRRRVGFVFQDGALLDSLTVGENLRLALDDRACMRSPIYASDRIAYALDMVNLPQRVLNQLSGELSGGMRKRVGVARAVINTPDILLYDEPTTGLDPSTVTIIDRLIMRMADDLGVTGVIITHDMESAYKVSDRIAMLHEGRVRTVGTPEEIRSSEDPVVKGFIEGRPELMEKAS
jgi:phospholipid/cholesterol/gamma-HCH transport system ATP-binding protein